jgi:hypothetical protein
MKTGQSPSISNERRNKLRPEILVNTALKILVCLPLKNKKLKCTKV